MRWTLHVTNDDDEVEIDTFGAGVSKRQIALVLRDIADHLDPPRIGDLDLATPRSEPNPWRAQYGDKSSYGQGGVTTHMGDDGRI